MQLRGHTLLWHRTIPAWMLAGDRTDPANYRVAVQQHLRNYIFAVVQHFPNVYAWDVVNEVASDTQNAANPYRTDSPWYQAYSVGGMTGSDYVRDAFMFANQARTSIGKTSANMKLMLNDYNTELPGKRANVIQIVRDLVNAGVRDRRRRPPVPPAARRRRRRGHRRAGGGRERLEHARRTT